MSLFLVMGIGFLSQRRSQQQAVQAARLRLQSKEIARAGLEDAVAKLSKRWDFPPISGPAGEESFTYTQELTGAGGQRLGEFTVTLYMDRAVAPYELIRLTSIGRVGETEPAPSQVTLHAELDVAEFVRDTDPPVPNPDHFRVLYIREQPRYE